MCNNILQFAHTYAFGREHGVRVIAMRFCYKYRYFHLCEGRWYHPLTYLFAKLLIKTRLIKCLVFDKNEIAEADMRLLRQTPLIAMSDWMFRFPDLFLKYKHEIKALFAFKPAVIRRQEEWLRRIDKGGVKLGIHIRRGDYATFMNGKYFFTDETYIARINDFLQLFGNQTVQVFICTNDARLNIDRYREALGTQEVYLSKGNAPEDLYLLSQCQYLMGPISTFSLVASIYNDAKIYWMEDKNSTVTFNSFRLFDDLFMYV